jgi:hypothetical protein
MPDPGQQQQFDGQTPVPGYTLFQGKDGQSFYLKGEGLSDAVIASKVAAIRAQSPGVSQGAPDTNAQAQAAVRKPIDQLQEKRFSIFTPTGDVPPEQLQATQTVQNRVTAATGALTAAPAVVGALAPTVAGTTAVGTGILDASGAEITKDVTTMGPSLARAGLNMAVNAIKAHPYISTAIATHLANALGIPVPKVLKAITLIPTGPAE